MKKRMSGLLSFMLIFTLAACSAGIRSSNNASNPVEIAGQTISTPAAQVSTIGEPDANSADSGTIVNTGSADLDSDSTQNSATHEETSDYVYDPTSAIAITLNRDSIAVEGAGVTVSGSQATITAPGTYTLSGTLTDGQIIVNSALKGVVRIVLNGVEIQTSDSAPIYVMDADKVVLILADNTQNNLSDEASYTFTIPEDEEPNAAIFSTADLSISGNGSLTVTANFRDGITSKDGLVIANGNITVNAADDGIRGKDYLVVEGGTLIINAQGDGMKSDNQDDATKGYIQVTNGTLQVTAGGDAINAETDVLIQDGDFTLISGGGSLQNVAQNTSSKGVKGTVSVVIDGGTFRINSADDSIHSNGSITINDGTYNLATGDDGMHADETLTINQGEIQISQSYEGIESALITINDGNIHITASDDGINVAGGQDSSGMTGPGRGAVPGSGLGQDTFTNTGNQYLYIHGGYIFVDANGDGMDINGAIEMSDGVVVINGPTEQMNGAIDYDAGFKMTGGYIVAAGSSGMAMTTAQTSSQPSVLIYLAATQPAGSLVHIQNSAGDDLLTFAPTKAYQSIAFSSPALIQGDTYTVFTGGGSSGTPSDGLYQNGSYTPGTQVASFTTASIVTTVGSGGRPGPNRRP